MAFHFPEDHPFDLRVGEDSFFGCRLVEVGDEALTFDYEQKGPMGRLYVLRAQVRLEDVKAVYTDAVTERLREQATSVPTLAEMRCRPS